MSREHIDQDGGTFEVNSTGLYPRVHVDTAKVTAVAQAGGVLLTETIRAAGLDRGLSEALAGWRKPLAVHDPGKILLDLAVSLALGGDALSDVAVLRGEPGTPSAWNPAHRERHAAPCHTQMQESDQHRRHRRRQPPNGAVMKYRG